jgi:hypothetical protein
LGGAAEAGALREHQPNASANPAAVYRNIAGSLNQPLPLEQRHDASFAHAAAQDPLYLFRERGRLVR